MRLIDADTFASVLEFADSDVCEEFPSGYCEVGFSREKIRELLRYIPATDAVPVVRCRECKYHHDCGAHFCDALGMDCPDDSEFYCSYGERKEGAD